MTLKKDDVLWEQVFEVLGSDDRLKRFLRLPRYELIGIMKAHGKDVPAKLLVIFRLIEKVYQKEAIRLVFHWGDYRAFAMILYMVRSIRVWKLETISFEGKKYLEV